MFADVIAGSRSGQTAYPIVYAGRWAGAQLLAPQAARDGASKLEYANEPGKRPTSHVREAFHLCLHVPHVQPEEKVIDRSKV
ncbi:hypothetical protein [Paraburkholderia sp. J41]|uniref:hypothetical protein n=1 Tax=Paraburkholderia sp. J41 TaxID=2805433 RepID=UPI002AC33343|nr:hypothetical protein [Paraburkholderia sp. J41]